MRGRQPRHVADTSLQPLHEQRVVPFQFNGWHGLLVQDFPVFSPEREGILYEVSSREIALIPIEEHGTLLVSLTRGYDPSHGRSRTSPPRQFSSPLILWSEEQYV